MPRARFCISSSRAAAQDGGMDIVAVLLGVLLFAALFALIYGIERI
jgi:hypothetical protein